MTWGESNQRRIITERNKSTPRTAYNYGIGMSIIHVGRVILPTPSTKQLQLRNVLHVPNVAKNLMSDARDNNVFVEFHPNSVLVKDMDTRTTITMGHFCDGFYTLDAPMIKEALTSLEGSPVLWYTRLGHSSSQVVQHIIQTSQLPSETNKIDVICDAC